ncbi:PadR family transcriptional regulator [Paenibacillus sacheonensis]|uniref:PadR family transcriptional regulator n=1 Tax=Paenibacillus sacheonensis TaxID=742054 RepID=A0A7X4YLR7_9BACL|nr:PadR family transcriptional regulator [Paenibacillus sacheonensis]MBM7565979.1 DNA-binding PadR family transcriptional regulator [Paenibacillus sacheonensis]NBC68707.1 PadR family transcriptional regulator [Paenibacillus sacheonensis]
MSMRLLILGLLMERERHPYEIRQTIKLRNWNECFKLRDGSLYYAVDQLRQDGLIEAAEVVAVPGDNRPDKTIYRITESGREAFLLLLEEQFKMTSFPQHPLFLAMPFVRHGHTDKIEALVLKQLEDCEMRIARMKAILELKGDLIPRGSSLMIEGFIRFGETEKTWLEQLLAEARSGKLFESHQMTPEQIEAYVVGLKEFEKSYPPDTEKNDKDS